MCVCAHAEVREHFKLSGMVSFSVNRIYASSQSNVASMRCVTQAISPRTAPDYRSTYERPPHPPRFCDCFYLYIFLSVCQAQNGYL